MVAVPPSPGRVNSLWPDEHRLSGRPFPGTLSGHPFRAPFPGANHPARVTHDLPAPDDD
jgi:hypothetical protein